MESLEHNAALYPDYLALLFAALAQGLQDGVFDKFGGKWTAGHVESESKKGDVYSEHLQSWDYGSLITKISCCFDAVSEASLFLESPYTPRRPDNDDYGAVPDQ